MQGERRVDEMHALGGEIERRLESVRAELGQIRALADDTGRLETENCRSLLRLRRQLERLVGGEPLE